MLQVTWLRLPLLGTYASGRTNVQASRKLEKLWRIGRVTATCRGSPGIVQLHNKRKTYQTTIKDISIRTLLE